MSVSEYIRAARARNVERALLFAYSLIMVFSILDVMWPPVWMKATNYAVLALVVAGIIAVGSFMCLTVLRGGWWRLERLGLWTIFFGFSLQVPLALLLESANSLWVSAVAGSIGFCVSRMAVIWHHDYAPLPPGMTRE